MPSLLHKMWSHWEILCAENLKDIFYPLSLWMHIQCHTNTPFKWHEHILGSSRPQKKTPRGNDAWIKKPNGKKAPLRLYVYTYLFGARHTRLLLYVYYYRSVWPLTTILPIIGQYNHLSSELAINNDYLITLYVHHTYIHTTL